MRATRLSGKSPAVMDYGCSTGSIRLPPDGGVVQLRRIAVEQATFMWDMPVAATRAMEGAGRSVWPGCGLNIAIELTKMNVARGPGSGFRFLARLLLLVRQRSRYKTEASSTSAGLKTPLSFLREGGGCVRL